MSLALNPTPIPAPGLVSFPTLYQVNIRVVLTDLSRQLGRKATLDDVPDALIESWADYGFDYVWLLSVWQIGVQARAISRSHEGLRREFERTLNDLTIDDIEGSGFAIQAYQVSLGLGGNEALERFRKRMKVHGLKLILDFVPNHIAPDHPWVNEHTDYIVQGDEQCLITAPHNYRKSSTAKGEFLFAMGRDPYFDGWTDTLQLNYGNPALQAAMIQELQNVSQLCDGVRCDMAMLLLPEVFHRTWGIDAEPFWPTAIRTIQATNPDFIFMAEVYWGLEWELMQQGFNFCYDKKLYDGLRSGDVGHVLGHLHAEPSFQNRLVRFLENHDEPRAASTFDINKHSAAAAIAYLVPGLRFFHQGQLEGRTKKIPPQLIRMPYEDLNIEIKAIYDRILKILCSSVVRKGTWILIDTTEAWPSNASYQNFVSFEWRQSDLRRLIVVVNFSQYRSQARLQVNVDSTRSKTLHLNDLMTTITYDRDTHQIAAEGLYVELEAWGVHLFQIG